MKRSTKIISIVLIFFFIIAAVIIARTMIGNHFKKKFSKRPPPGIIVQVVEKKLFQKLVVGLGFEASQANQVVEKALDMVAKGIDQDDFVATFKI